jgi:polyhydroxyalkanoate synthesis regulator phasin
MAGFAEESVVKTRTTGECKEVGVSKPKLTEKPDQERLAVNKQREENECRQRLERINNSIAESERNMADCERNIKAAKAECSTVVLAMSKRQEFLKKNLELLQKEKGALSALNYEQAKALEEERQELNARWCAKGELTARLEAERAKWNELLARENGPEVKEAFEKWNKLGEQLIGKIDAELGLQKEIKCLKSDINAARHNLEKLQGECQRNQAEKKEAPERPVKKD